MSNPYDQNPEQNAYGQNPDAGSYGQQSGGYAPSGGYNQPGSYNQPVDPNQGGYGQNPYGQSYPAYGMGPQPHPQGTTVLVLGIVGLVVCFIVGIFGLIQGNKALKEIDANPAAYNNRQSVVIGRILSIIGIVLQGGFILVYAAIIIGAIATGTFEQ